MPYTGDFEAGLDRVHRMEKPNQDGRGKNVATPKLRLRGDKNPISGGGINRSTKSFPSGK